MKSLIFIQRLIGVAAVIVGIFVLVAGNPAGHPAALVAFITGIIVCFFPRP